MDRFYFSNGDSAGSLEELLRKLKVLDDECFYHHVTEYQNDFANWIRECVGDKTLGKRVGKLNEKQEIIDVIDKKVNSPARVKKGIIDQIKEAILHG